MSRALRRHPVSSAKPGKPARPPQIRPGAPRPRSGSEARGLSSLLRPTWATDIIAELRKVTWPSREDTQYLTVVVLIVSITIGIFLGGVDMFFNWAIDRVIIP